MNKLNKLTALTILTIVTLSIIPVGIVGLLPLPVNAQQYTITPSSSYLTNYSWIEVIINAPGIDRDNVTVLIKDASRGVIIDVVNGTDGSSVSKVVAKKWSPGVFVMYLGGNATVGSNPMYNKTDAIYAISESSFKFGPGEGNAIRIEVPELGFIATEVTYDYAPISVKFDRSECPALNDSWIRLIITDPNWNKDPTAVDALSSDDVYVNITITNSTGTKTIMAPQLTQVYKVTATTKVTANEIAINSAVFRFNFTLKDIAEFAGVSKWSKGDVIKIEVVFKNYTDIKADATITLTSVAPTIELTGSFSDEITVRVTSPDNNLKSWGIDRFNISLRVYPKDYSYNSFSYVNLTLEETDYNTGVFEGMLVLNWTAVKSKVYAEGRWVDVEKSLTNLGFSTDQDLINNASKGKAVVVRANMTYAYEGKEVVKELVITPVTPTVTLDKATYYATDTIKVTVVDPDLNDDINASEVYISTSLSANAKLNDVGLSKYGIPYLYISLLKLPEETPVITNEGITLSLIERYAEQGTFDLKINLSKLVIEGDKWYRVKVYDLTSGKNVTTDFYLAKAAVSIEFDRDTYPLVRSASGVIRTDNKLVIYVRITDPTANKNPYAKDVLPSGYDVKLLNYTMNVKVSLAVTFTETDVNSGVFEAKIELDPNILGSTDMISGVINVSYVSPYGLGSAWKIATFKPSAASITVTPTVVKFGDTVVIRVVDPDMNLDSRKAEEITLPDSITIDGERFVSENARFKDGMIKLKETDVNSGVFEGKFVVAGSATSGDIFVNLKMGKTVELKYFDFTPAYITPGGSWDNASSPASFNVATTTGKIYTDKAEYGPGGIIMVYVEDLDANKDPKIKDVFYVSYSVEGLVGTKTIGLEETDVNSGVFKTKIYVSNILSGFNVKAKDLIGKRISFTYKDDCDAEGKSAVSSAVVKVISVDPVITFDKASYDVGDVAKITVKDLDANIDPDLYDTIVLRVYSDSDPVGTTIAATETSNNSGVFEGTVLVSSTSGSGRVFVKYGDKIYVEYKDSYPADYPVTEKAKVFTASVPVGVPVEKPITPKKAEFVDPRTGVAVTPKVGSMVGISVELSNVGISDQVFTAILVVKDPEGIVVKVDSISIPLAAGKSGTVTFSVIPKLVGDYVVEVYIVKSLADWSPLGEMLSTTMSVVS